MSICNFRLLPYLLVVALVSGCVTPESKRPTGQPVTVASPTPSVEPTQRSDASALLAPAGKRQNLLGWDSGDRPVYASDFRGQVLVVSYWASWCPPCWAEMPELERLRRQYTGRGLRIVAVNFGEDETSMRAFLDRQSPTLGYTLLRDPERRAGRALGVVAVPTTQVYRQDGEMLRTYVGLFGFDIKALRQDIKGALSVSSR